MPAKNEAEDSSCHSIYIAYGRLDSRSRAICWVWHGYGCDLLHPDPSRNLHFLQASGLDVEQLFT